MTTGTPGNDVLFGTDLPEAITGAEGSDTIAAGGGNDVVFGDLPGAGNDSLSGGAGNDSIFGGDGRDTLDGGEGADFLIAEPGDDSVIGGGGADTAFAGDGNDTMLGGDDRDFLIADAGNDSLDGGEADDVAFGGSGNDTVIGGNGVDFLFGDAGADSMLGGAGNDRLHVDGADLIADAGAGEFDVLVVISGLAAIDLGQAANQNTGGTGPALRGFEAVDASLAAAGMSITGAVLNGFGNVLFGTHFNDTITGSAAIDIILGNPGNDVIIGGGGDDTLFADAGNDTVDGGAGDDTVFLPNLSTEWQFTPSGGGFVATRAGVSVTLTDVETALFTDASVDLGGGNGGENDPPQAANDTVEAASGSPSTIPGGALLLNDSDPDAGDSISVSAVGTSASGAAVSLSGGNVIYDPGTLFQSLPDGQTASDSFTYTIADSEGLTDSATVTIVVTGGNDPPVAGTDLRATSQSVPLQITASVLLQNDTDPDGDTISFVNVVAVSEGGAPIELLGTGNGSQIIYRPETAFMWIPAGQVVVDRFNYFIEDESGAQATGVVEVTLTGVNDAPAPEADNAAIMENQQVSIFVLDNDSDPDQGDIPRIDSVQAPESGASVETNGTFIFYDPGLRFRWVNAGDTVIDSFTYTVRDNAGLLTQAVVNVAISGLGGGGGGGPGGGSDSGGDGGTSGDSDGGASGESSGDAPRVFPIDGPDNPVFNSSRPTYFGSSGPDSLVGDFHNDGFIGGDGNDTFDGAGGINVVMYASDTNDENGFSISSPAAVNVNLANGSAIDGWGNIDTLRNIQMVSGSEFNDTLRGSSRPFEQFHGYYGNDSIDGGAGFDVVSYDNDQTTGGPNFGDYDGGVTVNLGNGRAQVPHFADFPNEEDTLSGIEGVIGSSFDDTLIGSNNGNFERFSGRDGFDLINGGGGLQDEVDYRFFTFDSVVVNLNTGTAIVDEGFDEDTLMNIEFVRGSNFGDTIIGDGGNNRLTGLGGRDSLEGGAGNDTLIGGQFFEYDGILSGGDNNTDMPDYQPDAGDTLRGGDGNDRFVFVSTDDISPNFAQRERITDFQSGVDLLDFSNEAFPPLVFGGNYDNLAAIFAETYFGEWLMFYSIGDQTLFVFTNDDTTPDGAVVLTGVTSLVGGDFVVHD